MTGSVMAEDPLCTHQPGTFPAARLAATRKLEYGTPVVEDLEWDVAARERMRQVPAFVRGMVVRSVESYCKKNGVARVTVAALEEIRARMPTPKFFTAKSGN
jgi:hypothetical protein